MITSDTILEQSIYDTINISKYTVMIVYPVELFGWYLGISWFPELVKHRSIPQATRSEVRRRVRLRGGDRDRPSIGVIYMNMYIERDMHLHTCINVHIYVYIYIQYIYICICIYVSKSL